MVRTVVYVATMLLLAAGFGGSGTVTGSENGRLSGISNKTRDPHVPMHVSSVIQASSAEKTPNEGDQREEYDKLQAELKRLMEEMKRLGKEGKKKIENDILPLIRKEIERLREKLRKLSPRDEDREPVGV
jgi:uncharacterized coiled-coil protein SlyX